MADPVMIRARWHDGALHPVGNYPTAWLHDTLAEGEIVSFEVLRDRSMNSHRHQFAEIRDAWEHLPENVRDAPWAQSPETLRKHALIVTGYCDVETIDAGSKAAAERVSAYVGALARKAHGYALTVVSGPLVRCYTPHSQSVRAMGGKEFQQSKTRVLDWIAAQIGTTRQELQMGAA